MEVIDKYHDLESHASGWQNVENKPTLLQHTFFSVDLANPRPYVFRVPMFFVRCRHMGLMFLDSHTNPFFHMTIINLQDLSLTLSYVNAYNDEKYLMTHNR